MNASHKELFRSIEATTRTELERAKTLRTFPTKIDQLTKTAHELLTKVQDDFPKKKGTAADVTDELNGAIEVLTNLSNTSRSSAREAEDFVADLQRAVQADPTDPLPRGDGSAGVAVAPPPPKQKPVVAVKPQVTTTQATPPKPKPKPVESSGEVFNP
jgi:hypothetical protein